MLRFAFDFYFYFEKEKDDDTLRFGKMIWQVSSYFAQILFLGTRNFLLS